MSATIRVGPAGWSYPDWEGIVYPRRKPAGFHALGLLARSFDLVEVNSTFYAHPRAELAERWLAEVASKPSFRFTAKIQQTFTHDALPTSARAVEIAAAQFHAGLEPLAREKKLAALLAQFPISFHFGAAGCERLELLARLFGRHPLVLEVRHRSWYEEQALAAIERLGFSLATIDLPAHRDHPPAQPRPVGSLGYLRLHGRNAASWFDRAAGRDRRYDYLYSPEEIAEIGGVVRRLASGSDETFVVTNNHFVGKAVANALEILAGLGETPFAPSELVAAYPHLRDLVRTTGQASFF